MATTRTANAHWEGSLMQGNGTVSLDSSGAASFEVSWPARAEEPGGKTSPEELIAAAHSACYSMALSHALSQAGHEPQAVDTRADVDFQPGTGITGIKLAVRARVAGLTDEEFQKTAEGAKTGCPVSQALSATPISLEATLDG